MAVFVTEPVYSRKSVGAFRQGRWWCHLVADTVEELHAFAARIGMQRSWFQDHRHPHYDLTEGRRHTALRAEAVPITTRDWIRRCRSKKQ